MVKSIVVTKIVIATYNTGIHNSELSLEKKLQLSLEKKTSIRQFVLKLVGTRRVE